MADPRLFVALPIPPPLTDALAAVQAALPAATWALRPTDPADFHLTLHFLGPTPERVIDDLKRELGAVAHARRPFDLDVGGLGCFPDERGPRVLWAGVRDPHGRLAELFEATRRVLNAYRLFKLRDEFQPHLTLARVSDLSRAWDPALLRGLAPQWGRLGVLPVERLRLMQSRPEAGPGPRYEALADLPLRG